MSDSDEIGRCGHCGHVVLESHRPVGSELAQCPGCGAEVAPAILHVAQPSPRSRPGARDTNSRENPWRDVPGQAWPRLASLDAPTSPGPPPLGFEVARDASTLEVSFPDPTPRSAGRMVATSLGVGLMLANFASALDSLELAGGVLVVAVATVLFAMRNRPVTIRLDHGHLTVRQKERSFVHRGVARVVAQEDGLRARLVAELHDGGTRDLLTGLERLPDARWIAAQLNQVLEAPLPQPVSAAPGLAAPAGQRVT